MALAVLIFSEVFGVGTPPEGYKTNNSRVPNKSVALLFFPKIFLGFFPFYMFFFTC